jgi:hypothetical protein
MDDWESDGPGGGFGGGMGNATTIENGEVGGTSGTFGNTQVEMLLPDGVAASPSATQQERSEASTVTMPPSRRLRPASLAISSWSTSRAAVIALSHPRP